MKLGLNLSFAVKRWLEPEQLARLCAEDFGVHTVQFTFDLINPWWPESERDQLAAQYRSAFEKHNITLASTFGGVASYSYAQLLSPTVTERDLSMMFFRRAMDLTAALGAEVVGTPIGGMSYADSRDPARRALLYADAQQRLIALSAYAAEKGLREIQIEATPLVTEFLCTPAAAKAFVAELDGKTAVPVRLLIDWGHALCRTVPDAVCDMEVWLRECAPYVTGIHLQQTDGRYDRHWDFTQSGLVNGELIRAVAESTHTGNIPQYLEVVPIFEQPDDLVLAGMNASMAYLHTIFDT